MIVKHRRGTTEEWKVYNLVPEAGELVVEECSNGFCRCKIGDGTHAFSELRYIDDYTIEELDKHIAESTNSFVNRLLELEKSYKTQLADTRQEIIGKIGAASDLAAERIAAGDAEVLSVADKNIDSRISDLSSRIDKLLQSSAETTNNRFSSVTTIFNDKLDLEANIRKSEIDTAASLLEQKISESSERVKNELNQAIVNSGVQVADRLDTTVNEEIAKVNSSIEQKLQAAKIANDAAIAATKSEIAEQHASDISRLDTSIETASAELLDELQNVSDAASSNLSTAINAASLDFDDKLNSLKVDLQEDIDALTKRHTNELTAAKNTLQDKIKDLLSAHTDAVDLLTGNIDQVYTALTSELGSVREALETADNAMYNELDVAQQDIKTLKNSKDDLYNKFYSVSASIAGISDNVSKDLDLLSEQLAAWHTDLLKKVNELETIQLVTNQNILNDLHTSITAIYTELLDLIDDDVDIIEKVFAVQNVLSDRIDEIRSDADSLFGENKEILNAIEATINRHTSDLSILTTRAAKLAEDIWANKEAVEQEFLTVLSNIEGITERISTAEQDIAELKEVSFDLQLRPDLESLKAAINDKDVGLAATNALADGAVALAYLNAGKISEINADYVHFEGDRLYAKDDIIVFNCGRAASEF